MKCYRIAQQGIVVILLSTISSCKYPNADPFLTGQIYINEQTQDRMAFTKKGTVIITWSADAWSPDVGWGTNTGFHIEFVKNHPYEWNYAIDENSRQIYIFTLTSSEVCRFPYSKMEISDSKDRIIVTRRDGHKELFMGSTQPTAPK